MSIFYDALTFLNDSKSLIFFCLPSWSEPWALPRMYFMNLDAMMSTDFPPTGCKNKSKLEIPHQPSINHSIVQSINRSINRSINHSLGLFAFMQINWSNNSTQGITASCSTNPTNTEEVNNQLQDLLIFFSSSATARHLFVKRDVSSQTVPGLFTPYLSRSSDESSQSISPWRESLENSCQSLFFPQQQCSGPRDKLDGSSI